MSETSKPRPGISFERLAKRAGSAPKPKFEGWWAPVELQPDPFAPQRLTVGVVVQGRDERLHFKLIDGYQKFDCLYGERLPHWSIAELMVYAHEGLRAAANERAPLAAVKFGAPGLALGLPVHMAGMEHDEVVESLFADVVVMAPAVDERKKAEFQFIDNAEARRMVNAKLKDVAGIEFERIVAEQDGIILGDSQGGRHYLDLNLTPPNACGSVVSVAYRSVGSMEMNLLKASLDLTTYSRIRSTKDTGLFLLLPPPRALEPRERDKMEKLLTDYEWKLQTDGFRVVSRESADDLAGDVYEWAKPHLAP